MTASDRSVPLPAPRSPLPLEVQCTHRAPLRAESRRRMRLVLGIAAAVMVAEAVGGYAAGSLALLADAGPMLTDGAGPPPPPAPGLPLEPPPPVRPAGRGGRGRRGGRWPAPGGAGWGPGGGGASAAGPPALPAGGVLSPGGGAPPGRAPGVPPLGGARAGGRHVREHMTRV